MRLTTEQKAKMRAYAKQKNKQARDSMFDALGHSCECCGETIKEFLTLFHRNNTAKEHRLIVGKGMSPFLDAMKRGWPRDLFAVYCMNCNFASRYGKQCPHKEARKCPQNA